MAREERAIRTLTYALRHGKIVEKYGSAVMFLHKEEIEDFEALYKALQERPKGRWIKKHEKIDGFDIYYSQCSNCKQGVMFGPTDFCPNCGADCRESEE